MKREGKRELRWRTGIRVILMVLIWCMGWQIKSIPSTSTSTTTNTSLQKEKPLLTNGFQQEKLILISLDIETGGEICGLIQLSVKIFRMVQHNSKLTSEIEKECFGEYVRHSNDAFGKKSYFRFMVCIGITLASKKQIIYL
mmetsp:Transcript_18134/g.23505  ORF Transcript_18134/g.23505 Transcript_18134/m.23505 type:complete len:141 (+) Transcript_18134:297-719(+)